MPNPEKKTPCSEVDKILSEFYTQCDKASIQEELDNVFTQTKSALKQSVVGLSVGEIADELTSIYFFTDRKIMAEGLKEKCLLSDVARVFAQVIFDAQQAVNEKVFE